MHAREKGVGFHTPLCGGQGGWARELVMESSHIRVKMAYLTVLSPSQHLDPVSFRHGASFSLYSLLY